MSVYMKQFAVPVTVSLLASLLLALTIIPLAMVHVRPRRPLEQHRLLQALVPVRERVQAWRERGSARALGRIRPFAGLLHVYQRSLDWAVTQRPAAIVVIAAIAAATWFIPDQRVGGQEMPTGDTREVQIEVLFDENFNMDRARETFEGLQTVVDRQREALGIKNVFVEYSARGGSLDIYLLQPEDLPAGGTFPRSTEEVRDILWQQLPERLPGVELRFQVAEAGEGQTGGIGLMLRGDDNKALEQYAEQFKAMLRTVPGLDDVKTDAERARQEMRVRIDEDLAEQVGVSPLVVARSVDFALRGIRLPYMKKEGREIPVWAQFREEDRKTRANLENVAVLGAGGELVPLNRLVTLDKAKSPQSIQRVNGKNVVTIEGKVSNEDLGRVLQEINARIAAFDLPPGYSIDLGEELEEFGVNMSNFATSLLLSVILIYIVMGALFESYLLPLSILTCVPLAFMGVYWAMFLTGTAMDTVAFIGCILMVGVVVNNGIIIIDHINQLRKGGLDRREAILQGGHDRLRPVMMTALTTVLGCVPLAIGGDMGGEVSFQSLGRALIGGMTTGTFLTLLVVPLFYTLIDDLRIWFLRYVKDLTHLARRPTPDAEG